MTETFSLQLNPNETLRSQEQLFTTTTVVDTQGFERTRFGFGDVEVQFRGREELPLIEDEHQPSLGVVLAADVHPLHTGSDRFGEWTDMVTGGRKDGSAIMSTPAAETFDSQAESIWEMAGQRAADKVVLHAPATPEGVIDTALHLIKHGQGDPSRLPGLLRLRNDPGASQALFDIEDKIFAASALSALDGGKREEGLMLATLAAAGNPEAMAEVENREKKLQQYYVSQQAGRLGIEGAEIEDPRVAEPGELVDARVIERVREAGLVAVHTTQTNPLVGRFLRATAGFNQGRVDQFPRDTIHFSMNHPVESHSDGTFSARPFTVVTPMAGLLEANGAPAAMADVDTYFAVNPGEGLVLPIGTVVIEMTNESVDGKIAQGQDKWVFSTNDLRSAQGANKLAHEIAELRGSELVSEVMNRRAAQELLGYRKFEEDLIGSDFDILNRLKNARENLSYTLPQKDIDRHQSVADDMQAIVDKYPGIDNPEELLTSVLGDDDMLATNETLHKALAERVRTTLVKAAIRRQGGRVVEGGTHYTTSYGFQESNNELAGNIGVPTGLHDHSGEAKFETEFGKALQEATVYEDDPRHGRVKADFDWTKFQGDGMWHWLAASPRATRRRAVEMGVLPYASRIETVPTEMRNSPF